MIFFVNSAGNILVTQSGLASGKKTLILPLLDQQISCLTMKISYAMRPAMQVQGTAGGANTIRVMGEDPPMLQLSGIIVGSTNCAGIRLTKSALSTGIALFASSSVAASAQPIQFSAGDGVIRKAHLVGVTLSGEDNYADVIQYNLTLLSEPVVALQTPTLFPAAAAPAAGDGNAGNGNGGDAGGGSSDGGSESGSGGSTTIPVSTPRYWIGLQSYQSSSLVDRPPANIVAASSSPLGATQRASDGSLAFASSQRGIVTLAG